MSKEFKAKVRKAHKVYTNEDGVQMCEMEFSKYLEMEKALTPPTADEVCEALKERFGKTVKMDAQKNFYYSFVSQHYGEVDEIICGYSWDDGCISFEKDLPPHLTKIVSSFYEGLEKEKENASK